VEGNIQFFVQSVEKEVEVLTDLPARFIRKSTDLHAVGSSAGARRGALMVTKCACFAVTGATGELDGEALAHEVGSIFAKVLARERDGLG
jgi:hypothetical protein